MRVIFAVTNSMPLEVYEKICSLAEELGYEILGFIDFRNTGENFSTFAGYPLYPYYYINGLKWDIMFVGWHEAADFSRFMSVLDINLEGRSVFGILWLLKQKMTRKYEDVQDPDIQETLRYWKNGNPISVFNQYFEGVKDTFDEVFTDESNGFPYIWFKTVEGKMKKMYYPKQGAPAMLQDEFGKRYVKNILQEQIPNSPHLYITDEHKINYGDILVDAGVCEGNFALKYVDVCSKIYLFECDPMWLTPLYLTFADYPNKVVLIPKYVSNFTRKNFIAIDDVVKISKQNVFLKMDIEGAEVDALHGAKNLLRNNKVKASVCSYHNADDLWKIKSIFKSHNYRTWTSNGYMVFIYNAEILETADFRKGIVYAENF